jgi:hypothetical protein
VSEGFDLLHFRAAGLKRALSAATVFTVCHLCANFLHGC